jgi:TatA/E family protein of Tat protein translocase
MHTLALFGPIGTWEALALLALGLLIFGRRLPEVGRGLGRSIVEFRKGLQGVETEIDDDAVKKPSNLPKRDDVARAPLTDTGEDVRVSRSASVESEPHPTP